MTYFLTLFFTLSAFAHGDHMPGPHHGQIRMPGAFHSEIVIRTDGEILIYLMDVHNKNPTIKDSSVAIRSENKTITYNCTPVEKTYFQCRASSKTKPQGKLFVKTKRLGAIGKEMVYEF